MNIKVTANPNRTSPAGLHREQVDGEDQWVAHVQLGTHVDPYDGNLLSVVIEGVGTTQADAVDRLFHRCKLWSQMINLNMVEAFHDIMAQIVNDVLDEQPVVAGKPKDEPS